MTPSMSELFHSTPVAMDESPRPPAGFIWRPNFSPPPGNSRPRPSTNSPARTLFHGHYIPPGEVELLAICDDLASLDQQRKNANRQFQHAQRHRPPRALADHLERKVLLERRAGYVSRLRQSSRLTPLIPDSRSDSDLVNPYDDPAILDISPLPLRSDLVNEMDDFIDLVRRIWVFKTGRSVLELDEDVASDKAQASESETGSGNGELCDLLGIGDCRSEREHEHSMPVYEGDVLSSTVGSSSQNEHFPSEMDGSLDATPLLDEDGSESETPIPDQWTPRVDIGPWSLAGLSDHSHRSHRVLAADAYKEVDPKLVVGLGLW